MGKLKTDFTSPIAKSTSPGLSDTTFFARCKLTLEARNLRLDPHISKLEFQDARIEFWDARIQSRGLRIQEARFSERTMLYSQVAGQIFAPSISVCSVVFCNWIVRVQQAFNTCKSISSGSYSVCSLRLPWSEIFTDERCGSAILWIKLVVVLCKSWWRLGHLSC